MTQIKTLLADIIGVNFKHMKSAEACFRSFIDKPLNLSDLSKIHDFLLNKNIEFNVSGDEIKLGGALRIENANKNFSSEPAFTLLTQLHGNEPAGLAAVLYVMALSEANLLKKPVSVVIGNLHASTQYFKSLKENPNANQESRDKFRRGVDENGNLLQDMNRVPSNFMDQKTTDHYISRIQKIYKLAAKSSGILDIHTARGNLVCITESSNYKDLIGSPIKNILNGLLGAISGHVSSDKNQFITFKTSLQNLENLTSITGIEAGTHESPESFKLSAHFTHILFSNIGLINSKNTIRKDTYSFYNVDKSIKYSDLSPSKNIDPKDKFYPVIKCNNPEEIPLNVSQIIVEDKNRNLVIQSIFDFNNAPLGNLKYAIYQYEEMEAINKNQIVAVGLPSGNELTSKGQFAGIFYSKSAKLYDKDESVGPWPVDGDKLSMVKFCYPCQVNEVEIEASKVGRKK